MNDHRPLPVVSSRMSGPLPGREGPNVICDLRVLVVEDSEEDTLLLLRELKKGGYAVHHRRVCTRKAMAEALDGPEWDLILSDHKMPRFDSLTALEMVKERGLDLPFIIVSAVIGEDTAVAAMKAGAHDYVMKGSPGRLLPAIARQLLDAKDRRDKRRVEELLRFERERAQHYLDVADVIMLVLDREGKVELINRKGSEVLGYTGDEVRGKSWFDSFLPAGVREKVRSLFSKYLAEGGPEHYENTVLTKSGAERIISWRNVTLRDREGRPTGTLSSGEDITERRRAAEKEAMQAVRLEALFQLNQKMDAPEEEILDFCLEAAQKTVQSELSFIGLMDEKETTLTVHAWSKEAVAQCAMQNKPRHFPVADSGLWGECVRQRKPVIVNDYARPVRGKKGYPDGHVPLRRVLCVPVFDGPSIVAVVVAANKERAYDEEDVTSLDVLMNRMWELLRRKRMEAALSQGEKRYRELVDNLSDAVFEIDSEGNITFVSHQVKDLFGLAPEECVGRNLTEIVHPDSVAGALEAMSKVRTTGSLV
jgi:PAS domain S-box-containing protein